MVPDPKWPTHVTLDDQVKKNGFVVMEFTPEFRAGYDTVHEIKSEVI